MAHSLFQVSGLFDVVLPEEPVRFWHVLLVYSVSHDARDTLLRVASSPRSATQQLVHYRKKELSINNFHKEI